jgi:hypothetical protein
MKLVIRTHLFGTQNRIEKQSFDKSRSNDVHSNSLGGDLDGEVAGADEAIDMVCEHHAKWLDQHDHKLFNFPKHESREYPLAVWTRA